MNRNLSDNLLKSFQTYILKLRLFHLINSKNYWSVSFSKNPLQLQKFNFLMSKALHLFILSFNYWFGYNFNTFDSGL